MIDRSLYVSLFVATLYFLLGSGIGRGEVVFRDDFESGQLKQEGLRGSVGWSETVRVKVSDALARSGRYAAEFNFPGSQDLAQDAFSELRFELGALYPELWIRFDLYVPKNYRHRKPIGAHNNKGPLMLWSGPYKGTPLNTFFHFWRSSGGALQDASIVAAGWKSGGGASLHYFDQKNLSRHNINEKWQTVIIDPRLDNGRWMDVIVHVKVAEPGSNNGIVQLWKNEELLYSIKDANNYTYEAGMNGFERGYLLGWANSGFDDDTVMYIDNVIFATSMEAVGFEGLAAKRPAAPKLKADAQ